VGRRRGAGAEVREDLVDHGPLRDAGDEAHHAVAGRAREGVDLEDLLQQRRPPAGGLGGPEPWRGNDRGRRLGLGRLGLTAHPGSGYRAGGWRTSRSTAWSRGLCVVLSSVTTS